MATETRGCDTLLVDESEELASTVYLAIIHCAPPKLYHNSPFESVACANTLQAVPCANFLPAISSGLL